jgi:DNA-binding NarL/FixJ family response regulator
LLVDTGSPRASRHDRPRSVPVVDTSAVQSLGKINGSAEGSLVVLVVDDLDVGHVGLYVLLNRQRWAGRVLSARCADAAIALAYTHQPAVAIVNLFVAGHSGTEICRAIRSRSPRTRVLLMSSSGTLSQRAASAMGAAGFVAKNGSVGELLEAVRAVGQEPPEADEMGRSLLSPTQQRILDLIAQGATNRAIAERLQLSPNTVKAHASELYRRLNARNRAEAVQLAERLGLLTWL